jgi:CheY-like chemotaxis protein
VKVFIIDDEPIVSRALQRAFAAKGHDVVIASSGDEAVEMWERVHPDLVLLDVFMPGFTGPQVLQKLKKEGKIKSEYIVLMTAHSTVKSREQALQLGAHDFVQKPFDNVIKLVEDLTGTVGKHGGHELIR